MENFIRRVTKRGAMPPKDERDARAHTEHDCLPISTVHPSHAVVITGTSCFLWLPLGSLCFPVSSDFSAIGRSRTCNFSALCWSGSGSRKQRAPFSLQLLSPVVQTEPSAFLPIEGGSPQNRDGVQPRPQATLSQ